ncbi:hypothetical protein ACQKOH_18035 [Sphingomonas sp. NPDC092331]|jgi:hypothetical protein|uniref:hypothetical protein n=1 Tax=unclassified Sphingomonas TaxID=196159 RepID=UPI0031F54031
MAYGPACPACGKLIPFWRAQWQVGSAFACKRCKEMLEVSQLRAWLMGVSMLLIFWQLRPHMGGSLGVGALILTMLVLGAPITYFLTRPAKVSGTNPPGRASD